MPSMNTGASRTWRTLEEYAGTPEFQDLVEREFPSLLPETHSPASRRQFLKVMGASVALAGMAGCRWPQETIVPFASRPKGLTPGVPQHFATAMDLSGAARPLIATSYDGRPVKLEGNPEHPASLGGADLLSQAAILGLYDPERSRHPILRDGGGTGSSRTVEDFLQEARAHFRTLGASGGQGLRVLSEASSSQTLARMKREFLHAFPKAVWHEYDPLSRDAEREGTRTAFGTPYRPHYSMDAAEVIVSLGADLLGSHPESVRNARDFASRRRAADGTMNRLYVTESRFTITGGQADHRLPVTEARIASLAWAVANGVFSSGEVSIPAAASALRDRLGSVHVADSEAKVVAGMVRDLLAHRGHGMVAAGPGQGADVHALAHLLNVALGNAGGPVTYTADPDPDRETHVASIGSLATAAASGQVETLVILGGNPAYDAPADHRFADALTRVPHAIHLSLYDDETSRACRWHLPRTHFLESWDDAATWDGTASVVQPLIAPLYGGWTPAELIAFLATGESARGHDLVRQTWRDASEGDAAFDQHWRRVLHDGFAADRRRESMVPSVTGGSWDAVKSPDTAPGIGMEVVFAGDACLHDGRFANNGWLQELPDPSTKLTWGNAALIAPSDAGGLRTGDVVRLSRGGRSMEIPAMILPGQAKGSVAVALGYGRTRGGQVAEGVGADGYAFRTSDLQGYASGVLMEKTGRRAKLAVTQEHHILDDTTQGRGEAARLPTLYRQGTLSEFRHDPAFARHMDHHPPLKSLWKEHSFDGHLWGMSIDLTACNGCSACVVACQAENNIPVVGPREVANGREMHWLRVDRYFTGDPDDPEVGHLPVPCQQCENAPCEQVCPVAATTHTEEGLNDMVYNRCIGTRYCLNNCPYKVRRYNWFHNTKDQEGVRQMANNPEVTVRTRGVMEKCTYCVQRITAVRIQAKNDGRPITDGEITPACAQTCPAKAIVFGDLSDPDSRVQSLREDGRSYVLLEELNIRPRTSYLARLRNPGDGQSAASGDHGHQDHRG
ncbi:MAG: TAT-variant-translocated molybdopterin oxidoreductase [Gemmatimonadota bacterium]|nr:TAT-variant-translocated molybdopterin oxidoreductase [Gemmatimonadota bacterium]